MPRSRRIDPDDYEPQDAVEEDERDEDPQDDQPAPRARRRRRDDDDEEPRPRRRRRRDEDEDEEPAPRRRRRSEPADEDDDEDEDALVIPIHRGRDQIKKNRPVGEGGDAFFRWDDEPQVVKFLDTEPWSYDQHWVKRQGKQSFPCMGKGCPLCEIGVKVTQKIVYTIVNLSKDEPGVQTLEVGITLDDTLATYDADKKTGPLDRLYWALSRSQRSSGGRSGAKYNYSFMPIKERDLEEDWEIDIDEAEAVIDAAEIPDTVTVTGKWTRAMLQEIADETMSR